MTQRRIGYEIPQEESSLGVKVMATLEQGPILSLHKLPIYLYLQRRTFSKPFSQLTLLR